MRRLEWHDGLNLGVPSIDEDHKKLVSLINSLSDAISNDVPKAQLIAIGEGLDHYVKYHFAREEALMRKAGIAEDEHLEEHQSFTNKIPELMEALLSSDSQIEAQRVSAFLFEWLIDHIIMQDLKLAPALASLGYSEHEEIQETHWNRFLAFVSERFHLKLRTYLSAVIPILSALILCGVVIHDVIKSTENTVLITSLASNINAVREVTHNLQIERGLSTGYLSSQGRKFGDQLAEQRQRTDRFVDEYVAKSSALIKHNHMKSAAFQQSEVIRHLSLLSSLRQNVDAQTIDLRAIIEQYSQLIDHILALTNAISYLDVSSDLSTNLNSLVLVMRMQEAAGRERAEVTAALNVSGFREDGYVQFVELLGLQSRFVTTFMETAGDQQKDVLQTMMSSDKVQTVKRLEEQLRAAPWSGRMLDVPSEDWFTAISSEVDLLYRFSESLANDVVVQAEKDILASNAKLLNVTVFLVLTLSVSVIVSFILTSSILRPIKQLTRNLSDLGVGVLDRRMKESRGHDELSAMSVAYEQCRRGLLREHFLSKLTLRNKDVEISEKTKQGKAFERMAHTDPLTGAINRRGFELAVSKEINRFNRYGRPLAFMMLDLDFFKAVNDKYGHAAGDQVLIKFAEICFASTRSEDHVARLGGEEFCILLPETRLEDAKQLAKRLCQNVRASSVVAEGCEIHFTVSIGLTQMIEGETLDGMMQRADEALYKAKQAGRDRVITV